jgi:hypothetical protein
MITKMTIGIATGQRPNGPIGPALAAPTMHPSPVSSFARMLSAFQARPLTRCHVKRRRQTPKVRSRSSPLQKGAQGASESFEPFGGRVRKRLRLPPTGRGSSPPPPTLSPFLALSRPPERTDSCEPRRSMCGAIRRMSLRDGSASGRVAAAFHDVPRPQPAYEGIFTSMSLPMSGGPSTQKARLPSRAPLARCADDLPCAASEQKVIRGQARDADKLDHVH